MTTLRALTRGTVAAFAGGTLMLGAAWAGVGLTPLSSAGPAATSTAAAGSNASARASAAALANARTIAARNAGATSAAATGSTAPGVDLSGLKPMPAGEFLVGASVRSLAPDPTKWQRTGCSEY